MSQTPPLPPPTAGAPGPGVPPKDVIPPSQAKDPVLMTLLGLIWIGYFFYGQWQKGLAALGLAVVLLIVTVLTCGAGAVLYPAATVAIMIDTYMQAQALQDGHPLGHWTFFKNHL